MIATSSILSATSLVKRFTMGDQTLTVLDDCSLDVEAGEFVAIEGRSGSGKSTLLHLLGGLDRPDSGSIMLEGTDLGLLSDRKLATRRNEKIGIVFQFYHLLPELNVLQNTLLAPMVGKTFGGYLSARAELKARARELLEAVGLSDRLTHRPNQLSGGERQRVAIARALMNRPAVLLADEPTGNLDTETGTHVMSVFESVRKQFGLTVVMVTHDRALARSADRVFTMTKGRLSPA
jgi:lipoprotein-releasing system ATP-binding protein